MPVIAIRDVSLFVKVMGHLVLGGRTVGARPTNDADRSSAARAPHATRPDEHSLGVPPLEQAPRGLPS